MKNLLRWLGYGLLFLVLAGMNLWAAAALYFDLPLASLRTAAAVLYAVVILALVLRVRGWKRAAMTALAGFLCVLMWWFTLKPSNNRNWQPDVQETAWVEINGGQVTIHNLRDCDYRSEFDYTPHWETRTVNLADLRGIDLFITYWGSPYIAHPIVSFDFGNSGHVAISVETRKEVGKVYDAVRGFFRYYELIYTVADERDVVRLRTNYRTAEEVYLYRTVATPERARAIFLDYLRSVNDLHQRPQWYNALTNNCTTNIALHARDANAANFRRYDPRVLLNGKANVMLYDRGDLVTDGLPLMELNERAHINAAARAAGDSPDFSRLVRKGRPGFTGEGERE
jgi:hypothetical protein